MQVVDIFSKEKQKKSLLILSMGAINRNNMVINSDDGHIYNADHWLEMLSVHLNSCK